MNSGLLSVLILCCISPSWTDCAWAVQAREHAFVRYARAAAARAGLPDLGGASGPRGDVELRLWDGFGLAGIRGLILQRTRDQWRASLVEPAEGDRGYTLLPLPDSVPWADRWRRAVQAGVLDLAPEAHRTDGGVARDGFAVVLELREAARYRTAVSEAVDAQCGTEARRLLAVAEIVLGRDLGCQR
jgi:hypothetical protein